MQAISGRIKQRIKYRISTSACSWHSLTEDGRMRGSALVGAQGVVALLLGRGSLLGSFTENGELNFLCKFLISPELGIFNLSGLLYNTILQTGWL